LSRLLQCGEPQAYRRRCSVKARGPSTST
jgi:hypothetical protein